MDCDSTRMTSTLPCWFWTFQILSRPEGYEVRYRHCHAGGLSSDCPEEVYGHLTHGEMLDVVCVLCDATQPRSGHLGEL